GQRPRVAAHEDASHVGPLPQLVEWRGVALVHHRELDTGQRRHPRQQPPPCRPERGRPCVHSRGRDKWHRASYFPTNVLACASSEREPSEAAATRSSLPYTARALSRSPESSAARPSA